MAIRTARSRLWLVSAKRPYHRAAVPGGQGGRFASCVVLACSETRDALPPIYPAPVIVGPFPPLRGKDRTGGCKRIVACSPPLPDLPRQGGKGPVSKRGGGYQRSKL